MQKKLRMFILRSFVNYAPALQELTTGEEIFDAYRRQRFNNIDNQAASP